MTNGSWTKLKVLSSILLHQTAMSTHLSKSPPKSKPRIICKFLMDTYSEENPLSKVRPGLTIQITHYIVRVPSYLIYQLPQYTRDSKTMQCILVGINFKIPLWNYNSITIIQQHLIIMWYSCCRSQRIDFVRLSTSLLGHPGWNGPQKDTFNPGWPRRLVEGFIKSIIWQWQQEYRIIIR